MRTVMLAEAAFAKFGATASPRLMHRLNSAFNYVRTGHWIHTHGFGDVPRVWYRSDVFDTVAREVLDERVLYMEFGVFQGDSMRYWSRILRHPDSRLHGFDSFEGLPEHWTVKMPKGYFSVEGHVPEIDDDRVRFFVGWFSKTLPAYVWPEDYERLVVSIDADLYSSTVEVLEFLEPHLKLGSFIYFDEFNYADHEQRAFDEFIERTGMVFKLRAATIDYGRVAFERVAGSSNPARFSSKKPHRA